MNEPPVFSEPTFQPPPGLRIVCILASAGGLEPLRTLIGGLRPGLGAAVLILQHFPDDRVSRLPELLAGGGEMAIRLGQPGDLLRSDMVFVLNGGMAVDTGEEGPVLVKPQAVATQDLPGDHLLRSVAAISGPLATAVVLSGTGRDGVEGLRAIRDAGGRTFVQAPATAAYDGMPRQAIEAGVADRILTAGEMAEALLARDRGPDGKEQISGLREICATLARLTGHDFHGYKQGTLLRRVHRRMRACTSRSLHDYAGILARTPAEGEALLADLLIGVTEFFRDAEAFEALGLALEAAGAGHDSEGFRAWVPGCATGEEAYSLAILLRERLDRGQASARLKLFASDIDVHALMRAKQGLYGPEALKGLSPERRLRWFHEEPDGLRVRKELQEACLFSYHNLLQDPPFSALDLVSCRNLFIYLLPEVQQRVVPMLHFALRPGGLLFLGPSDGIGALGDLFEPLDPVHRIYRRREVSRRPTLDLAPPLRFAGGTAQINHRGSAAAQGSVGLFEKMLLQEFVPPAAILNAAGDVLYGAGGVGRYLLPAAGYPSGNLLQGGGALQAALRGLIHRAAGDPSGSAQALLDHDGFQGRERLRVTVRSLPGMGRASGTFAVILAPAGEAGAPERGAEPDMADAPLLDQLDIELRATRAELQMTVEDLESANEELRSSNEELQTSQEELQSVNEELVAINRELQEKVQALHEANADLQNLFSATDIATLFLDTSLRLARFTPAATALFGLLPTDTGRPIQDLSPRFSGLDLPSESRAVLEDALPRERQVRSLDGQRWYVVRILPYRNLQQEVKGAVVTFVDTTEILRTQEALADREDRLRRVQAGARACTWEMDVASGRLYWSPEFYALLGLDQGQEPSLALWRKVVHPEDAERVLKGLGSLVEQGRPYENEYRVLVPGGGYRWILSRGALEPGREPGKGRLAGLSLDITARKEAELRRAESEERLETALVRSRTGAWAFDPVTGEAYRSREQARIFGESGLEGPWSYATFLERVHPEDREWVTRETREAAEAGRPWDIECRILRRDGALRWIRVAGGSDFGTEGAPRRMAGIVQDITDRKTAEQALWESEARFRTLLSAMGEGIAFVNAEGRPEFMNNSVRRLLDLSTDPGAVPGSAAVRRMYRPDGSPFADEDLPGMMALRTGQPVRNVEMGLPMKDGSMRWLVSNAEPVRREDGTLRGAAISFIDITDRRRAEEELARSERRFAAAFHASPDAIAVTHAGTGVYQLVNEGFTRVLGYTLGQVVGRSSLELDVWADPEERGRWLEQLRSLGQVRDLEARFRKADGQIIAGSISSRLMHMEEGEMVLTIIRDLTQLRADQEARRLLEIEVTQNQKMESLGRLAGGVAHDMNNVLGAIFAVSQTLRARHEGDELLGASLETLERAAARGRDLVKGLVGFSRKDSGAFTALDLNDMAAKERDILDRTLLKKYRVETDLQEGLPMVMGEAGALGSALMNLCVNAVDAMPGGGDLCIRTRILPGGFVMLEVEDTGEGMPPEVVQRAMEPFFTTKPQGKGTGLGLAQVFNTARAHGGQVSIHSEVGQGTCVRLVLPSTTSGALPAEEGEKALSAAGRRILLVDDDELLRATVPAMLELLGHEVRVAEGGAEALARLDAEWRPDLVMLDMNMPGMGGLEVLKAIRAARPDLPVIIATGYTDEDLGAAMREDPRLLLSPKPFTMVEFQRQLRIVDALLGDL